VSPQVRRHQQALHRKHEVDEICSTMGQWAGCREESPRVPVRHTKRHPLVRRVATCSPALTDSVESISPGVCSLLWVRAFVVLLSSYSSLLSPCPSRAESCLFAHGRCVSGCGSFALRAWACFVCARREDVHVSEQGGDHRAPGREAERQDQVGGAAAGAYRVMSRPVVSYCVVSRCAVS